MSRAQLVIGLLLVWQLAGVRAAPVPISPQATSLVNATISSGILGSRSTAQAAAVWAAYLVNSYGSVLVPQPTCFEQERSPTDVPTATILNYLPRLQEDLSTTIKYQYYMSITQKNTILSNSTEDLGYVACFNITVNNLINTMNSLNDLVNMLKPFVPTNPLAVIKTTQASTTIPPTNTKSSDPPPTTTSATTNQSTEYGTLPSYCFSSSYDQQYVTALRLQGMMDNYLYQDLLKIQSVMYKIK